MALAGFSTRMAIAASMPPARSSAAIFLTAGAWTAAPVSPPDAFFCRIRKFKSFPSLGTAECRAQARFCRAQGEREVYGVAANISSTPWKIFDHSI